MKTKTKKKLEKLLKSNYKPFLTGLTTGAIILLCIVLSSCNATRTITTTQTHVKGNDTIITMTTRTTESYDAKLNPKNY